MSARFITMSKAVLDDPYAMGSCYSLAYVW